MPCNQPQDKQSHSPESPVEAWQARRQLHTCSAVPGRVFVIEVGLDQHVLWRYPGIEGLRAHDLLCRTVKGKDCAVESNALLEDGLRTLCESVACLCTQCLCLSSSIFERVRDPRSLEADAIGMRIALLDENTWTRRGRDGLVIDAKRALVANLAALANATACQTNARDHLHQRARQWLAGSGRGNCE
jgi:hypothetical protein